MVPGEAGRGAPRGRPRPAQCLGRLARRGDRGQDERAGIQVARVLAGIDAAAAQGLPVKVNCVVQRGVNDGEILSLCEYFRARGHTLRFIEFMDVGNTNHWSTGPGGPRPGGRRPDLSQMAAGARGPAYRGEVAARYRYRDGPVEIGPGRARSPSRSAGTATGRGSRPTGSSSPASLRRRDGMSSAACGPGSGDAELAAPSWPGSGRGRLDRYSDERAELLAAGRPARRSR